MATWQLQGEGKTFVVTAPDSVPEADVIAFTEENAASWVDGGHYRMELAEPAAPVESPRNKLVKEAVASLEGQMADISAQPTTRQFVTPGAGAATGMTDDPATRRNRVQQFRDLEKQRDRLTMGTAGQTVGGVTGALVGGGVGARLGAPLGVPGMAGGALVGSIVGAAGGVGLGTHLWDIPQAREAMDISDEQAAQLIQQRMIESVLWDGAFVLLLGPGAQVIGKMVNGQKFLPALRATGKQILAWDDIKQATKASARHPIEQRASVAPKGIASEVTDALNLPRQMSDQEAAELLIQRVERLSGGGLPTEGEVRGIVKGKEMFARKQAPLIFFENDKRLGEAAEAIRRTALRDLDNVGAYDPVSLGQAIDKVKASAMSTLKRVTGPIFDRAANTGIPVNMDGVLKYLRAELAAERAAGRGLLTGPERQHLETILETLEAPLKEAQAAARQRGAIIMSQPVTMTPESAQRFISGNLAASRRIATNGEKPTEYMEKVLVGMNKQAGAAFDDMMRQVPDATLRAELGWAKTVYRQTMEDIHSESMLALATKNPEDVGRSLLTKGTVTEIRDLRRAMDRAMKGAPSKPRYKGMGDPTEMGKEMLYQEKARIDAGLIKGYIEANTQSLADLGQKLRDPMFAMTLRELLSGPGVANPILGRKVLAELDRAVGAVKLITPQLAPQPGRVMPQGVGSMGGGTIGAAATGDIRSAVAAVAMWAIGARTLGRAMAHAMTNGHTGALRQIQRIAALAPAAGKNVAAAEAIIALGRELKAQIGDDEEPAAAPTPAAPSSIGHLGARG